MSDPCARCSVSGPAFHDLNTDHNERADTEGHKSAAHGYDIPVFVSAVYSTGADETLPYPRKLKQIFHMGSRAQSSR